jgi:hypothetical protein
MLNVDILSVVMLSVVVPKYYTKVEKSLTGTNIPAYFA